MVFLKTTKRILIALRRKAARRSFKHASVTAGSDVTFGPFARWIGKPRREGSVRIGNHVYLDCTVVTVGHGEVTIGSDCWIGGAGTTAIGAARKITIGSNVIISNHVHIYDNNNHPTDPSSRLSMTKGEFFGPLWEWSQSAAADIVIGDNVWIGEFSYIGKGVTIGEGAIVGAHAVVTRDVPAYAVVVGNPGRVVKSLRP